MNEELEKLTEELKKVQSAIGSIESMITTKEEMVADLQSQLDDLSSKREQIEKAIEEKEKEVEAEKEAKVETEKETEAEIEEDIPVEKVDEGIEEIDAETYETPLPSGLRIENLNNGLMNVVVGANKARNNNILKDIKNQVKAREEYERNVGGIDEKDMSEKETQAPKLAETPTIDDDMEK